MLRQVHDELVLEAANNAVAETQALVKQAMEQAASLSVPLTVETGCGHDWGVIH